MVQGTQMAMKRLLLFIIFSALIIHQLIAQESKEPTVKTIPIPDSTFIDSLEAAHFDAEEDTTLQVMPLEELEDYIISLQDTFFNYEHKSFELNEYYRFSNAHYVIPNEKKKLLLNIVTLNTLSIPKKQLYPLLEFFTLSTTSPRLVLKPLQNSFKALLTDVQYSNGDYNNENKYIGFIKNNFLHLADVQLFAQSGENRSPWGKKNYYDNFIFNVGKKLTTKNFSSHSFSYTFFKLFSALEIYNVFNPGYASSYVNTSFQKTENISNISAITLFDGIISFSTLHQFNKEIITSTLATSKKKRNILNRYQLNLGLTLPFDEYASEINMQADIQDIHHQYYTGWLHDYLINIKLNSPGIFGDFYSLKIINDIIFSQKPDTIFIMPELVFDIPITESISSQLSVGARRKEKNFYYDGEYALDASTKVIFSVGSIMLKKASFSCQIDAFYEEIRNDGQWQWLDSSNADSSYYKHFDDYHILGGTIEGDLTYDFLTIDSKLRFKGTFSVRPDTLINYPSYRAKIKWTNRKHLQHRNFIYANADISYIGNFLTIKGNKINHQIFCSAEVGLSIKRFLIYLKLTNLFNILDSNCFMYSVNEVNPFGISFGVEWNFIN